MRNFNENAITDTVLERVAGAQSPQCGGRPSGAVPYYHLHYGFGLRPANTKVDAA
jgi:hypothetical protein